MLMVQVAILFCFILAFEYFRSLKRKRKKCGATHLTIHGKIIDHEITNRPYYATTFSGGPATTVKNLFMLIVTIEDDLGKIYNIRAAESSYNYNFDPDDYGIIGEKVNWKVKRYSDENEYILISILISKDT